MRICEKCRQGQYEANTSCACGGEVGIHIINDYLTVYLCRKCFQYYVFFRERCTHEERRSQKSVAGSSDP